LFALYEVVQRLGELPVIDLGKAGKSNVGSHPSHGLQH
jgi:hypothetical protein